MDPHYEDENIGVVLPPIMGVELIHHARHEFNDPELRRQFHELALAVFKDAKNRGRPVSLILESMGVFIVRRKKLAKRLGEDEIKGLIADGYIKPSIHSSGEPILIVRLPELLASELAAVIAAELGTVGMSDPVEAARWIANASCNLPLGDIVAAQAIIDCVLGDSDISREFIVELLKNRPTVQTVKSGSRLAAYMPRIGLVDFTVRHDGGLLVHLNGQTQVLEPDSGEGLGAIYDDFHSWMILSHLATIPAVTDFNGVEERFDPYILREVGSAPIVLRSVGPDPEFNGVLTHEIKGVGSIVCHKAGIVEPITFALFAFLEREGRTAADWVTAACESNSLPLVARLHIALDFLADMERGDTSVFANEMLDGPVATAFKKHPPLHPGDVS